METLEFGNLFCSEKMHAYREELEYCYHMPKRKTLTLLATNAKLWTLKQNNAVWGHSVHHKITLFLAWKNEDFGFFGNGNFGLLQPSQF